MPDKETLSLEHLTLAFGDAATPRRAKAIQKLAESLPEKGPRKSPPGTLLRALALYDEPPAAVHLHVYATRDRDGRREAKSDDLFAYLEWHKDPDTSPPKRLVALAKQGWTAENVVSAMREIFSSREMAVIAEAQLTVRQWARPVPVVVPELRSGDTVLENSGVEYRRRAYTGPGIRTLRWLEKPQKEGTHAEVWLRYSFEGAIPEDPWREEAERCSALLKALTIA